MGQDGLDPLGGHSGFSFNFFQASLKKVSSLLVLGALGAGSGVGVGVSLGLGSGAVGHARRYTMICPLAQKVTFWSPQPRRD